MCIRDRRDAVLYGYYGLSVNMTDGKYTYLRAAAEEDNTPLYLYLSLIHISCCRLRRRASCSYTRRRKHHAPAAALRKWI